MVDVMTSTELLPVTLAKLAADLESGGFVGHDTAVRSVVQAARARGVSPVLVDILADPGEPEVARLRAFGRVAATLSLRPPAVATAPVTRSAA